MLEVCVSQRGRGGGIGVSEGPVVEVAYTL